MDVDWNQGRKCPTFMKIKLPQQFLTSPAIHRWEKRQTESNSSPDSEFVLAQRIHIYHLPVKGKLSHYLC